MKAETMPAARTRLLLAEDDPAMVELLRYTFEKEGFAVVTTPSGEEALLLASESPPDIVILDWMLEELSGIEVCRRMRRAPESANVPIIMLTARGEEVDRVRGLETGADDYVTKPFSPPELIARIRAVLRRVRPALAGMVLSVGDLELDMAAHKVRRGGTAGRGRADRVQAAAPPPRDIPATSSPASGLLDAVWGRDSEIEARTVDVYVRRLRRAINSRGEGRHHPNRQVGGLCARRRGLKWGRASPQREVPACAARRRRLLPAVGLARPRRPEPAPTPDALRPPSPSAAPAPIRAPPSVSCSTG